MSRFELTDKAAFRDNFGMYKIFKGYVLLLVTIHLMTLVGFSICYAQDQIEGVIEAGSTDNRATITVTNPDETLSVENVTLSLSNEPKWIRNIRIEADSDGPLSPGESRVYTIRFDAREDAGTGISETMVFNVFAEMGIVDPPELKITIKIQKADEETERKPPVLKLVEMEGPESGKNIAADMLYRYNVSYNKGETGFSLKTDYPIYSDKTNSISAIRITKAPLEIILGKPFEFAAELKLRTIFEKGAKCFERPFRLAGPLAGPMNPQFAKVMMREINVKAVGSKDLLAYCTNIDEKKPETYQVDGLVEKDDTIKLQVVFTPEKVEAPYGEASLARDYHYKLDYITNGKLRDFYKYQTEKDVKPPARSFKIRFARKIDERGYRHPEDKPREYKFSPLKISASALWHFSLYFYYDTIHEGESHITSLPDYQWPPELQRPPRDERGKGTTGTDVAGGTGTGTGSGTGTGTGTGEPPKQDKDPTKPITPDSVDPTNSQTAGLITEWMSVARPPENAVPGNNVRYSSKGSIIGKVASGTIEARHDPAAIDPVWLWKNKRKLDSVDHCTLEEYVVARLENKSTNHCQGRYGAVKDLKGMRLDKAMAEVTRAGFKYDVPVPGTQAKTEEANDTIERQEPGPNQYLKKGQVLKLVVHTPYVSGKITLPNFIGEPLVEALKWLKKNELKMKKPKPGSPAPTKEKSGTVEAQKPVAGTAMKAGDKVTLTVHSKYVDIRRVPDVVDRPLKRAMDLLAKAGFVADPKSGGKPTSEEQAGTVKRQNPISGTSTKPGSKVVVFIYGPYVDDTAVPDLKDDLYTDALRKLKESSLRLVKRDAGKPPHRNLAKKVQGQEPPSGTKVAKGQKVLVWFYDDYAPSKDVLVAQKDCSNIVGSRAYWDDAAGKPKCGCFGGLTLNLSGTHCVSSDVKANELCTLDYPGSVARGRTSDGKINCECPQGYTWSADGTRCEKQLSPETLCARNYPGSVPTGRAADGRVNCDCPQGYMWANNPRRCVKKPSRENRNQCAAIIGRWNWFTGYVVDFYPNGTWTTTKDGHTGTWQCNSNGSITYIPDAGGWRDTVSVSADGSSLSGKNKQGVRVRATRVNKPQRKRCYVWCTDSGSCSRVPPGDRSSACSREWWRQHGAGITRMQECPCEQSGGGGGGGGSDRVCPPGYYRGSDGTCAKVGSGTFGQ